MHELNDQLRLFPLSEPRVRGYVYAIRMPNSRAIKIGWTGRSPQIRARELGGELLAYGYGTLADEGRFHRQLSIYRIGRTEDFWPAGAVWDVVESLDLEPPVL